MKAGAIILILLSHQGHWFGGRPGTISVSWAFQGEHPPSVLVWDMFAGEVRLAGEQVEMSGPGQTTKISITPPKVRVPTTMRWICRVMPREGGDPLVRQEVQIHVYPDSLLSPVGNRLTDKRLIVWDRKGTLSSLLREAHIDHEAIGEPAALQFRQPDLIVVAPDELGDEAFDQTALMQHARSGASVVLFEQRRPDALAGYTLGRRPPPSKLEWRVDHPLLANFELADLQSWLDCTGEDLRSVQLPADESALEIAWWPREIPGEESAPIDALVVTRTTGKGRIVLCQIPLGDWSSDPRSQQLLANVLDYGITRPQPTPPPGERPSTRPARTQPASTILIPPGDLR